jgi:hypothetical protein
LGNQYSPLAAFAFVLAVAFIFVFAVASEIGPDFSPGIPGLPQPGLKEDDEKPCFA